MRFSSGLLSKVKEILPSYRPTVIFDVGANIGETCLAFLEVFPDAKVYAFEPIPSTFDTLTENVGKRESVVPVKAALGERSAAVHMTKRANAKLNRIIPEARKDGMSVHVEMTTGDEFCRTTGVDKISYLKIDTEGNDLNVLVGFQKTLSEHRVELIETEVSMNRRNTAHVPFEYVKAFLEPMRYHLFHIFEQFPDTKFSGLGYMRRCNAVFVSEDVLEANRRPARTM